MTHLSRPLPASLPSFLPFFFLFIFVCGCVWWVCVCVCMCVLMVFFFSLMVLRQSPYSHSWPRTHYVEQVGLDLTELCLPPLWKSRINYVCHHAHSGALVSYSKCAHRGQVPWSWRNRWFTATWCGYWDVNTGPEEQQSLFNFWAIWPSSITVCLSFCLPACLPALCMSLSSPRFLSLFESPPCRPRLPCLP